MHFWEELSEDELYDEARLKSRVTKVEIEDFEDLKQKPINELDHEEAKLLSVYYLEKIRRKMITDEENKIFEEVCKRSDETEPTLAERGYHITPTKKFREEYKTPKTGWTWEDKIEDPPETPLRTKDGRVPKIGIVVGTAITYFDGCKYSLDLLFERLRYLESLFPECNLDRLLAFQGTLEHATRVVKDDWSEEINRWKLFSFLAKDRTKNVDSEDWLFEYLMKQKYDFVLHLWIHEDDKCPLGYNSLEMGRYRHTLQACVFSSRGNVLFMNWGIPSDAGMLTFRPHLTDFEMAAAFDSPLYRNNSLRRELYKWIGRENHVGPAQMQGFASMLRLHRYIRPLMKFEDMKMSKEAVKKIHSTVRGHYFTRENQLMSFYAGYLCLLFPDDLVKVSEYARPLKYYRWKNKYIQAVQEYLARTWAYAMFWYYNDACDDEEQGRVLLLVLDWIMQWVKIVCVVIVMVLSGFLLGFLIHWHQPELPWYVILLSVVSLFLTIGFFYWKFIRKIEKKPDGVSRVMLVSSIDHFYLSSITGKIKQLVNGTRNQSGVLCLDGGGTVDFIRARDRHAPEDGWKHLRKGAHVTILTLKTPKEEERFHYFDAYHWKYQQLAVIGLTEHLDYDDEEKWKEMLEPEIEGIKFSL